MSWPSLSFSLFFSCNSTGMLGVGWGLTRAIQVSKVHECGQVEGLVNWMFEIGLGTLSNRFY